MTVTDRRLRQSADVDPGDHWSAGTPRVHLSGVQATIRVLVDVLRADRAAGKRTAAFVSGYQGSPLAGFDKELETALRTHLDVEIVHRPAVNEELGATAVMGSQLSSLLPSSRVDGVLGVWYGKAPGLDRSMDALRHASFAGASATGGALALVGDDPSAKSSTLPSASEASLADLGMPVLFPRSLEEILELGRHAVALSRYSGAWVGIKLATAIADAEGTVALRDWPAAVIPETPGTDGYVAPPVSGDLLTPATVERERAVLTDRVAAAARYGDANALNRLLVVPDRPRLSIVAAGIVYSELVEALRLLGLDHDSLRANAVALGEVRMPFPIGQGFARAISEGVERVVVVEERRDLVESQLLSLIARRPSSPAVLGKLDLDGRPLVPRHGVLDAASIARILGPVLRASLGTIVKELPEPRRRIELKPPAAAQPSEATRVPWFCPGCPHSVSTVVPEGTLLGEGIGCHTITHYMPEDRVGHRVGLTQMGGEGAQWIGMEPFVGERHLVQNLGDGTFFHSGQLAVRAAVAAGVPITYKVLWNGATAMTGGQQVVGAAKSPVDLARMLLLEGARRVVITTDDPRRFGRSLRSGRFTRMRLPRGVSVRSRDDIVAIQEELAAIDGVTVLVHDQPCATELRRARKRGLAPVPTERVVINERVCEGCGDCQVKSNCLSLQTVDTPLGPKTRVDEDSCNFDTSCLKGDCPAFTLVKPGPGRRDGRVPGPAAQARVQGRELPPAPVADPDRLHTVRIAGIGGTGVVTCAHLLAWAALLEGVEVWGLDQTGLSQKAGPVISDLRIGPGAGDRSNVLGEGEVDLLIAADLVAAGVPNVLSSMAQGRTSVVGSSATSLSGPMVLGLEAREVPVAELEATLARAAADGRATFLDAVAVAHEAGASATAANVVLLGAASQIGELPVSAGSIVTAIERNGVAVDANVAAFEAGRRWVVEHGVAGAAPPSRPGASTRRSAADAPAAPGAGVVSHVDFSSLPAAGRAHVEWLAGDLVAYQDETLARRFAALVSEAAEVERRVGGDGRLTAGVAFGYHKLLAYKDEYEVARLLLEFPAAGPSDGRTTWLLHPPALRAKGLRRKIRLGSWSRPAMKALRSARRVRGTALDPFGRTKVRRTERELPVEYAFSIRSILSEVGPQNLDAATAIARLPDLVRGYESVKEKSVASYRAELAERLARFPRE